MPSQMDHNSRNRVILALVVALVIVCALGWFMSANSSRIMAQNTQYLESSTSQSVLRIAEVLDSAEMSARSVAQIYEDNLTEPDVDPDDMTALVADTPFDYFMFCEPGGMVYAGSDGPKDASDREYYLKGMLGESGVCDVDLSLFNDESILVFYSPVRYDDGILGVLAGVLSEHTVSDILATYFFGTQTSTYLCKADGTIVGASATLSTPSRMDNLFDLFLSDQFNCSISREQFEEAFASGAYINFTYEGTAGTGIGNAMALPNRDWMLVRTFPSTITAEMVSRANQAGIVLALVVVGALVAFIVMTLVQSVRMRKRLQSENKRATNIIDASANLFRRFVVVDFPSNTYEYVRSDGTLGDLPLRGEYNMLRYYWRNRIVDPEDQQRIDEVFLAENIIEALSDGRPYIQYDYRVNEGEGESAEVSWLQISVVPLARDMFGKVTSVLVTVQDVTASKRREMEQHMALEDALHMAEHASKAKSDFLNNMSHDIRTPMNSIMGLTAIAQMHIDDPEHVKDCLGKISTASRHLLGLINEVLDMAKIESGNFRLSNENFSLPETIEGLLGIMTPQIEDKKQELKVEISPIEHENVIGDPMRLQQVFVNIMSNSVKFTPMGGTIGIGIAEMPSRIAGHGCYRFTFSDTGCGMSEEFLERIFEPFSRANDTRVTTVEGTGLGMSIVRNMVTMMNGTIDIESTLGEGTTFVVTVFLKLAEEVDEEFADLKGVRVLVVDDDISACESSCALLHQIGMEADFVTSGQQAVERIALERDRADANRPPYRVIILDWRMPGMSGIETTRAIRERLKVDIPIIILSAYDWLMIEQEARQVGVDAFISKPIFRSRLAHTLHDLLSDGTEKEHEAMSEAELLASCDFSGKRVLLVEDNSLAAAIAEDILTTAGLDVTHAENGRVAVDTLAAADPGTFDLVLMDIQMPLMNGYEATKAIRAMGRSDRPDLAALPIVALTADAFSDDVERTRAAGMNAHMAKPMEIPILVETLNEWIGE